MSYERPVVQRWGSLRKFLDLFFPKRFRPPATADWRVRRLKDMIDSDPTRVQRNLDLACEELGLCVSGRQARRLFKECTGMGIKEYRKKRRLGAAAEQLRTTDTPVKVIAGEAGYRHVSTFTKYFLKQFHLCPMDFRRIWREKDATAWQAQANDRTYSVYPRS